MKMMVERKESKTRGKSLEDAILAMAARYEAKGNMVLRKVDPPTVVKKIGGKIMTVQKRSEFLDFHGTSRHAENRPVKPIVIEAKTTQKNRLEIGKRGLKQSQLDALRLWHHAGCVCGVIVRYDYPDAGGGFLYFWIEMTTINHAVRSGLKSIPLTACEPMAKTKDGLPHFRPFVTPKKPRF